MMTLSNVISISQSKWKLFFTAGGIACFVVVGVDWLRSTSPWPATEQLLTDAARCEIEGNPMTNAASEQTPIAISPGTAISIVGDVPQWDLPFAQSTAYRPGEPRRAERIPMLFVAFRQQGWLNNLLAGSFRYDGKTGLKVLNEGSQLRFEHRLSAPSKPGTYRVQLHVLEQNPVLLAKMEPREACRPLGVLAEALVVVE